MVIRSFLGGIASLFFAVAVISFFWGGIVIKAFTGADRILAEMEGLGVGLLIGGFGAVAKNAQKRLDRSDDQN